MLMDRDGVAVSHGDLFFLIPEQMRSRLLRSGTLRPRRLRAVGLRRGTAVKSTYTPSLCFPRGRLIMARRKKGKPVHGWLVLDKPVGMTSTQAVGAVRRLFDARRPATPARSIRWRPACCRSRSARRPRPCRIAVDGAKAYRFTVRWGVETDTDDAEGADRRTSERRPSARARSRRCCRTSPARSCRRRRRSPPSRSTANRAYDLARAGEVVELEARPVAIDGCGWSTCRTPTRPSSRPNAARAPTCARSPATWAARSAASATSSPCAARASPLRRGRCRVALQRCEAAAEAGEDALHGCCCRSRRRSRPRRRSASARAMPRACCAGRPC